MMIRLAIVMALALALSACVLFQKPVPVPQHDPVRTLCAAIGQIKWSKDDTADTKKEIKVHNATRRALCPPDRYPEWYYGQTDVANGSSP